MNKIYVVYRLQDDDIPIMVAAFSGVDDAYYFCEELEQENPLWEHWIDKVSLDPEPGSWHEYCNKK